MGPETGPPSPEAALIPEARRAEISTAIDGRLADGLTVFMDIEEQKPLERTVPGLTLYRTGNSNERIREFKAADRISSTMVDSAELSVQNIPSCNEADFLALAKQYGDGKLYQRSDELGITSFNIGLIHKTEQDVRTVLADRGARPGRGVEYHFPGLQAQWRARARLNRTGQVTVEFFRPKQESDQQGRIVGKRSDGSAYYLTPYLPRRQ